MLENTLDPITNPAKINSNKTLETDNIFTFNFESSTVHEIRTIKREDGSIWFVAKDVCQALGIVWKGSSSIGHLDYDDKNATEFDTPGGRQLLSIVSESGLYILIFKSRKPEAKKFCKWVTSEVLPQIRKTGAYMPSQPATTDQTTAQIPCHDPITTQSPQGGINPGTIKELEDQNYIHKIVTRANGKITGTEYLICDRVTPRADAEAVFTGGKTNRMRETNMQETAPIITTDKKQILNTATTTTPEPEPEPEPEPDIKTELDKVILSSCSSKILCELIPEKHKKPMVVTLVNKATADYSVDEIKEAIAYAAGNVHGGPMQFKAYLDKTLKNKWAEGFFESKDSTINDSNAIGRAQAFLESRRRMSTEYLKMEAQNGCKVCRQVLKERESRSG